MICARCDLPIVRGQEYESLDKFSASGAGISLRVHTVCPGPADAYQPDCARRAHERQ